MYGQLSRWSPGLVVLAAVLPILAVRADDAPDLQRGQILLQRLTERTKEPPEDRDKLRNEILTLGRRYGGTEIGLKAAGLLRQLPSALDRLDPKNIPELETFAWQPKELVGILGEHRGRHGSAVSCVAFSPDGKLLVSAGGGYLRVWNPATMRLIQVVSDRSPTGLAFSKDGKMLAVCRTGAVSLFNVTTGDTPLKLRFSAACGTSACYGVAFHPSSKRFAVACLDNHIRLFDTTGEKKEPTLVLAHEKAVQAVAYSPDGKTLASGSADKTIRLWDATLPFPKEKAVLAGQPAAVTALAFSPAGTTLASGCSDSSIRLWTVPAPARGARERVTFGEAKVGAISSLNFSATGNTLAAGSDNTVRLWSLASLARPQKLEGHAGTVASVVYSPDNKLIATGSADCTCRTWEITKGVARQRFVPWSHLSLVSSSSISPDCQTLASVSLDRVLRLWDLSRPDLKTRHYLKGDSIPLYGVAFSPDGTRLASSGSKGAIRQWNPATGRDLPACKGLPGRPSGLAYSPDGKYLLVHLGLLAYLFDAQTGQEVRQLTGHTTNLFNARFAPDGKKVVTCAGNFVYKDGRIVEIDKVPQYTDTTVRIWDSETGNELAVIKGHKKRVYQAFFSPDGKYLYSGGEEVLVRRETADLNKPETPAFAGLSPQHTSFQFSPDGTKVLAISGWQVKLWDLATWKALWEGKFVEPISNATFASDSRHLAVSLGTGVIYIIRLGPAEMK